MFSRTTLVKSACAVMKKGRIVPFLSNEALIGLLVLGVLSFHPDALSVCQRILSMVQSGLTWGWGIVAGPALMVLPEFQAG